MKLGAGLPAVPTAALLALLLTPTLVLAPGRAWGLDPFVVVLLPDTQGYTENAAFLHHFEAQT